MNEEKRRNLATSIISIGFLITISILILLSGISFPNVFQDVIQSKGLNFPVVFIFLIVFLGGVILGLFYLNHQSEEEEFEPENKTV